MNRQRGFNLVTAMFVLVVLGLLGGYMVNTTGVQFATASQALQGARAYQAARAGIEWAAARISAGGSCADVNAQTAMNFAGLESFSVALNCASETTTEADRTLTLFRIRALSQFGAFESPYYTARQIEVTIVR